MKMFLKHQFMSWIPYSGQNMAPNKAISRKNTWFKKKEGRTVKIKHENFSTQSFCITSQCATLVSSATFQYKKTEIEQSDRGWDGYIASPTQWTWIWANSGR